MKKLAPIIIAGLMAVATTSQANPNHMRHHGNGHYGHHTRGEWMVPLVIGSVVGYAIAARPTPAPVVIQPTYNNPPLGYHYEQILDGNCNCYRIVLVQN